MEKIVRFTLNIYHKGDLFEPTYVDSYSVSLDEINNREINPFIYFDGAYYKYAKEYQAKLHFDEDRKYWSIKYNNISEDKEIFSPLYLAFFEVPYGNDKSKLMIESVILNK